MCHVIIQITTFVNPIIYAHASNQSLPINHRAIILYIQHHILIFDKYAVSYQFLLVYNNFNLTFSVTFFSCGIAISVPGLQNSFLVHGSEYFVNNRIF